jgi:hypothetical protein
MNVSGRAIIVAIAVIAAFGCAVPRDVGSRFHGTIASFDTGRVADGDDARWSSPRFDDGRWKDSVR